MVIQFLMGLGDHYDNMKNHNLIIDPLPNIRKVFSMVQRVERQRGQTTMAVKNFNLK